MCIMLTANLRELKLSFGAEILDADVAGADKAMLDGVINTFHRHGAILLRGQTLTPDKPF